MSIRPEQYWIIATTENEEQRSNPASRRNTVAAEHQAFIKSLDDRGILLVHGAARDELGVRVGPGFIVFAAPTRQEAEQIARTEPYIANGFRTLRLLPWQAKLGRAAAQEARRA